MKNRILISLSSVFIVVILHGQEKPMENVPKDIVHCLNEFGKDLSDKLNI